MADRRYALLNKSPRRGLDEIITGDWTFLGSVGIGTSTPLEVLDVVGNVRTDRLILSRGGAGVEEPYIEKTGNKGIGFFTQATVKLDISVGGVFDFQAGNLITTGAIFVGAITATSFGGIASANLLDKSATEVISGAYTITGGLTLTTSNLVAGTIDADFDALTATSYGNILEANLVDKTAAETITGLGWHFDDNGATGTPIKFTGGGAGGDILQLTRDVGAAGAVNIGMSGGDPQIKFVNGAKSWAIGLDETNDKFVIANSGAVATTQVLTIDSSNATRLSGSLRVNGDIGFYNTAPIAKQTGVAVTAAGVHAALVNLGLIT